LELGPLISSAPSAAVAIAMLWLFISGKIHSDREFKALEAENAELKRALAAERQAVNETAAAGGVTNQLIGALASLAAGRQDAPLPRRDVTAKDLGL
jgi:hypothetical protein